MAASSEVATIGTESPRKKWPKMTKKFGPRKNEVNVLELKMLLLAQQRDVCTCNVHASSRNRKMRFYPAKLINLLDQNLTEISVDQIACLNC